MGCVASSRRVGARGLRREAPTTADWWAGLRVDTIAVGTGRRGPTFTWAQSLTRA